MLITGLTTGLVDYVATSLQMKIIIPLAIYLVPTELKHECH
jgi:hypothetical protein